MVLNLDLNKNNIGQAFFFHLKCMLIVYPIYVVMFAMVDWSQIFGRMTTIYAVFVGLICVLGVVGVMKKTNIFQPVPLLAALAAGVLLYILFFFVGESLYTRTLSYLFEADGLIVISETQFATQLRAPFYFVFMPNSTMTIYMALGSLTALLVQICKK